MLEAERRPPSLTTTPWRKTLPPATRWVLQGDAAACQRAAQAWGCGFSQTACRAVTAGSRTTLWLGPEEYLLLDFGAPPAAAGAAEVLEQALSDLPHALVDVSHRQFALEISGVYASTVLSGACPLDLDESAFPVGMCTRTVFAKADIVLWRTRTDVFHLEVWRSFADYVAGQLDEIAREFDGCA